MQTDPSEHRAEQIMRVLLVLSGLMCAIATVMAWTSR